MADLFNQPETLERAASDVLQQARDLFSSLNGLDLPARIYAINELRILLHQYSPFAAEPVDCIQWVLAEDVAANDYNPNTVAPPEMTLLAHSILEDGYTQPIVAWKNGDQYEVVDGFHRNRVGKESVGVRTRVHGYLPLAVINQSRLDKADRIAATIRHNRARGKHQVGAMSDIVVELRRRNWSEEKIGRELGMEPDEILRLCQVSGLAELFQDSEFSQSWEVGEVAPADVVLEDVVPE